MKSAKLVSLYVLVRADESRSGR